MKQTILIAFIFLTITVAGQNVPQKLNYQAVARNTAGAILANQVIAVKADILDADQTTSLYSETHNVTTNQFGLFTLQVGGGSVVSGNFSTINWGNGNKFIRTSADLTGGTSYQLMGVSQLLSVPYALYAGSAANNGGKTILILSDTISDIGAQAKIAAEFGPNTQEIRIIGCTNLTTVDLSMVTKTSDINIVGNNVLQNVNLSNLKICEGRFYVADCNALTTLNLSSLERVTSKFYNDDCFKISGTKISTLNLPSIKKISWLVLSNNNSLTSFLVPNLINIGLFSIYNNNILNSLSFPSLISIDYTGEYAPFASISSCPNLSSITFNSITSCKVKNVNFCCNKLPSSQINYLLSKFVSITPNLTGISLSLDGQTPAAPPTGQGITDKATLISRGNTVATD